MDEVRTKIDKIKQIIRDMEDALSKAESLWCASHSRSNLKCYAELIAYEANDIVMRMEKY